MHPDEYDLDALLDGAMDGEARLTLERHLAICTVCAARLNDRRRLFALIESAPDVVPERSLRAGVVARLQPQPAPWPRWTWALAALQAALAIALVAGSLVWIGPEVISRHLGTVTGVGLQTAWDGLRAVLAAFLTGGQALSRWMTLGPSVIQSGWILALAAAAAALGLFGNGVWFALSWGKVRKL
jgi:anti-sigma factor RsiW